MIVKSACHSFPQTRVMSSNYYVQPWENLYMGLQLCKINKIIKTQGILEKVWEAVANVQHLNLLNGLLYLTDRKTNMFSVYRLTDVTDMTLTLAPAQAPKPDNSPPCSLMNSMFVSFVHKENWKERPRSVFIRPPTTHIAHQIMQN